VHICTSTEIAVGYLFLMVYTRETSTCEAATTHQTIERSAANII